MTSTGLTPSNRAERDAMTHSPPKSQTVAPAWIAAAAALVSAATLAWWDVRLAAIPLAGFMLLSLVMPFFPRLGYFGPVICKGSSGLRAVALTFDDGPDPQTTPRLLALLARKGARAAFFVTGAKAQRHPGLVREILAGGHAVGNHSFSHDYRLYFRNGRCLEDDIMAAQQALAHIGIACRAFRPPAGIVSPRLPQVVNAHGLFIVNYSCRALDRGNRRIRGLARRILRRVRPDDIILLHDLVPKAPGSVEDWLKEIDRLLVGLRECNLAVLPLADLIGRPVMELHAEPPQKTESFHAVKTHP